MSEVLSCRDLHKVYGKKEALAGIDLDLEQGKIYGLIGRNGAGKTTLLSCLSAQNPATSGTITLGGAPVWENRENLKKICFSREINPSSAKNGIDSGISGMKVKEYLRIASIFYDHWDQALADRLIEEFELDIKKKINALSKGMLSMVTMIVGMASKAPFTFLDEPAAGVDIISRENFYRMLIDEYSENGRTFVISTHIIEEAADVMEEVVMIDHGKLLLKENTADLIDSVVHLSGEASAIDRAVEGLTVIRKHKELSGRGASASVKLLPGQSLPELSGITVQRLGLQEIFVEYVGGVK